MSKLNYNSDKSLKYSVLLLVNNLNNQALRKIKYDSKKD